MSGESSSENLFEHLDEVAGVGTRVAQCSGSYYTMPVTANLVCSASSASVTMEDESTTDWYLITIDALVIPPTSSEFICHGAGADYIEYDGVVNQWLSVTPVDGNDSISNLLSRPVPVSNIFPAEGTCQAAVPPTTENSTSYSLTMDQTVGISVGIFGTEPNATVSESLSISNSVTYTIQDVEINNRSEVNQAAWAYELKSASRSAENTFAIHANSLFERSDPLLMSALRSSSPSDYETAPVVVFEINMKFSFPVVGVTNMSDGGTIGTTDTLSGSFDTYIAVRVPPLPYGTKVPLSPVDLVLEITPNPASVDEAITFTTTVPAGCTGTVGVYEQIDGQAVGHGYAAVSDTGLNVVPNSTAFGVGTHEITSSYSGDETHAATDTPSEWLVVN